MKDESTARQPVEARHMVSGFLHPSSLILHPFFRGIRWKLTLWYALILALLLSAFSAAVYWTMRHHLLERIDEALVEELADVQSEIDRASDSAGLSVWLERRFGRHEGFDFQITHKGRRFFTNERMADKVLPAPANASPEPLFETATLGEEGRWRVVSVLTRGPDGPLTVQVARSMAAFEHESEELLWAFLLAGPLTILATLAGGYFLAARTLAPVQAMTETAREVSGDQLGRRVEVANPDDELGQLAATLNDMLERLERSFAEMRRFTADAAHELRTPLAVIRNEAEVALRQPRSGEEYGRALENVLEETVRLSRLADELLFLCRQEAGLNPQPGGPVQIGPLLEEVVGNMRQLAQEKGVELALEIGHGGTVLGDAGQFRRVFYNLLDNAVKHTQGGRGRVRVVCRREGGEVVITVADTGVGIAEEHLPHIFGRFYRADPSRTAGEGGAGLGLAICRSVVQAAGGTITASSRMGAGSEFTVRLPCLEGISEG
jgi:heavy metal sensor kinase